MRNMKRKIVSVVIAFFAMAVTCAGAFADTVTFDKKNKGNEKDFVTFEFRSSTELASLCKKYPKNNAEVLIQAGSPLGKIPVSNNDDAEFFSIIKCFPGAEFSENLFTNSGVRLNADSDGTTFENDALIEFKFDGKAYSLSKVTGQEPSIVSFFKFKLKDRYYYHAYVSEFINDLRNGICNEQKYEFRSTKEFEKLREKHKDELFCVIIPANSKIRNEKELEKLSKLIFNDSKTIKDKYNSNFTSTSTVVIEPLIIIPQDRNDPVSSIDQTISSLSSVSKGSRKFNVCEESDSTVIKFEKAILNSERKANEKAGLGKITNEEVKNERKQNEAAGYGRLTNAELVKKLENERAANEKAGLGKLTNDEVEKERKQNEAAGYGRLTNTEVAKKLDAERTENDNAGFGGLTNAEAEEERKANKAAGNGAITNAELLEIQGTGSKACSVYFFDFEVKDKAEYNANTFPEGNAKTRMETALENRKQYEFNLLTTLKKLDKGHEKESISITIPVGAKMWNEKDMVSFMEYFYHDTSAAQEYVNKFIMPKIKENKPVIFERYVYEGNRYYSIFRYQSLADQFEAEKEKERIANEAAGRGRFTNAEINKQSLMQFVKQAKAYEQKKQWAFALNSYYDAMALDVDPYAKKEAVEGYNALKTAIESGNPGFGKYNVFDIPGEWKNLLIDAEKCACTFSSYDVSIKNISFKELDYKTKTATYVVRTSDVVNSDRYNKVVKVIERGYKTAWHSSWPDLPKPADWPKYSVSGIYTFNYPEGTAKDSTGNNLLKTGRRNFNAFGIYFTEDLSPQYKYINDEFTINDAGRIYLFEYEISIVDENGKPLTKGQRFIMYETERYTVDSTYNYVTGISPEVMNMIDNGKAFAKITGCYLKYGYGEYISVYGDMTNKLNQTIGKYEANSLVCDLLKLSGALSGKPAYKATLSKSKAFIHNLKDLKVRVENPNAKENVEKAFELWGEKK